MCALLLMHRFLIGEDQLYANTYLQDFQEKNEEKTQKFKKIFESRFLANFGFKGRKTHKIAHIQPKMW